MTESQKNKVLSPKDKQHEVLPGEADPKTSLSKAMNAAIKASVMAKKVRRPK